MNRAVFLDRDGVLTRALVRDGKAFAPLKLAEAEIPAEVAPALARLKSAAFLLVVITNQPDVARGLAAQKDVEAIHAALRKVLPLDGIFVCYHDDADGCACRKPQPGMLFEAARKHAIDLAHSFMIGDRWRDVDAGAAAGCRTILIECGYSERPPENTPDARVTSLREAVDWILRN